MRVYWEMAAIGLVLASLAATVGCGSKGDGSQPATASIAGADGGKPPAAETGAAAKPSQEFMHPVVVIDTSMGAITVQLDSEKAPWTVENFLNYVKSGHYDQTIFHQVFKDQGILGGAFAVDLTEKATRTAVFNEARNGLKNRRKTISMVRAIDAPNSATCQFLLNVADNDMLDHKDDTPEGYGYCVFGEVTSGMEVVDKIACTAVTDTPQFERTPVQAVIIKSIRLK